PVQSLKELGATLVDICGQQDFQSLRHRSAQRDVLDGLAGHGPPLDELAAAQVAWTAAVAARDPLAEAQADPDGRTEPPGVQARDLGALAPRAGEYAALEREHTLLAHRLRIGEALDRALTRAYDDEEASAQSALGAARRALDEVLR